MPLWIKPDRKVTIDDMIKFLGDHLEGTELDMTKDAGAGPYGNPYRWRPLTWKVDGKEYCNERAAGTQQTGFTFISQLRSWLPDPIGGIIWFAVDDAANTVFTPIYCGSNRVPETFAKGNGKMMEWSENSAFWIFNQVSNFAYTRYSDIHPEIAEMQQKINKKNYAYVNAIDKGAAEIYKTDKIAAVEFITDYSVNTANDLTYKWKGFYKYLFMKYMDGNIKTPNPGHLNPNVKQPGYSPEFL
jgi:dipeptidase